MKHIRLRLIDLIDQHGDSFDKCPGCAACEEIKQLRKSLDREPAEKFKRILDKGQDMTKSDIAFLLECGVQKRAIQKALKMQSVDFGEMMTNFGFAKRGKYKEEKEVAKITLEEYQDSKAKGLTDKDIAIQKNIHPNYLPALKKQWFKKDEKPAETAKAAAAITIQKLKQPEQGETETKPIQTSTQPEDDDSEDLPCNCLSKQEEAEYERLIAALRADLTEAHKQLDERDEKIRNLDHLHDACEDCENEIASLQKANEDMKKELLAVEKEKEDLQSKYEMTLGAIEHLNKHLEDSRLQIKPLEEENQAMRLLIKKWA